MDDLISREQALDAIHDWKPSDVFDEFNPTTAFTIIYALPSANTDLSGYSDRLWKSAYDRGYERCKQDAIDALKRLQKDISGDYTELDPMVMAGCGYIGDCIGEIQDLPSAQVELYCAPQPDLSDDGTLMMTVPNGMLNDVKRVLVDEVGTKNCKVMYQDEPERKKGRWIIDKDCEGKSRTITCNLCGHKEFNWHNPSYCENCGADMRGEQNGND